MKFEIRSKSMGDEQRKLKRQQTTKVRLLHTSLCFACGTQGKYTNKQWSTLLLEKLKSTKSRRLLGTEKKTPAIRLFNAANMKHQFTIKLCNQLYLHTYTMDQSHSWEIDRFSASQEITLILRHPKVPFRVKCPPRVPILNQISPANDPPIHFLKNRLNIILPPTPGLSKRSLFLSFSHHNPVCTFPLRPYVLYAPLSHFSRFDIWRVHKLLM